MGRIEFAQDLCAAAAIYHQSCSTYFMLGRSKPDDSTQAKKAKSMNE